MLRSLFFKLFGAFALVIAVLAAVASVLANQATAGEFRTFADRSGEAWARRLAPTLSGFYSQNGTWDGVAGVLQEPAVMAAATQTPPASRPSPTASPTATAVEPTATPRPSPSVVPTAAAGRRS